MHGNRIREWRDRRDLTQEELAGKAGTTQATIQRLETGRQALTARWIMVLAQALNVDEIDLLPIPSAKCLRDDLRLNTRRQSRVLARRGLTPYTIVTDSVARRMPPGSGVIVDSAQTAPDAIAPGSLVAARVIVKGDPGRSFLVLRQYTDGVFTTNRAKGYSNYSFSIDDDQIEVVIEGVAEPDDMHDDNGEAADISPALP